MALTIDGSAASIGPFAGAASASIALTTTKANDLIVVVVPVENAASPHRTVTSVTAAGLTFTKRSSFYMDNVANGPFGATWNTLEIWSAPSTGILTAKSITVNLSGAPDTSVLLAFGVNLDSVTIPVWSGNGSLPATNSSTSATASAPTVPSVSTNAAAMVLGFVVQGGLTAFTGGSGYTIITQDQDAAGAIAVSGAAEEQVFASAQSAISVAFGGTVQTWGMIADAIEAPSAGDSFANSMPLLMMREAMIGWVRDLRRPWLWLPKRPRILLPA